MADKAILTKIKALLAKAASSDHEAEAEAFFAKAYELMEKYQIDTGDLEKDDPLGNDHVAQRKGAAAPDWDFRLMFAVAKYFGCRAIQIEVHSRTKYHAVWRGKGEDRKRVYEWDLEGHYMDLIGRESARITAVEMHKYLVTTVRRLGREAAANDERFYKQNADTWSRRIGVALQSRLFDLAPKPERAKTDVAKSNALVTVDKVLALYKKLHPEARVIGGAGFLTSNAAEELANGIGLNLQTGHDAVKQLR